ncbi:YbhB/YbcL family Raf kinase inhibitor-like protein (plasmid) [Deinococcus sp. KNUC1210]|uniref:YbhB/YbcL family Raf kinase inhibitor-like protein n=1 Tax=Deinococcus sp. KNUC1210 TaxID=2917691 RepID=UPI001EF00E7B|nr:YbhB/YbcL family Raf kinase inhibitor-like protein [Deinococcus sp. KNUC1210]ULH14042.1 YbhB/YbcL family Raf kinase inhibitor-like protein [Deinococcus sp. KNUC1210]
MNRIKLSVAIGLLSTGSGAVAGGASGGQLTLTSSALASQTGFQQAQVLNGLGCSGGNLSPSLSWFGAPVGTKSYAVTLYDPDAPTGSGWWHWVVYNIPSNTTRLAEGAGDVKKNLLPVGAVQGNTDFGQPTYGGPCPPQGDQAHRYILTLYALDVAKLDLPRNATAAFIGFNLHGHTLAKTTLTKKFGR